MRAPGSLRSANARVVVPLIVAAAAAYWVTVGVARSTFAPLGRDQGIFQYVAWALSKGERDYVDVRDINGPLVHAIHLVLLKLGGGDERVFRTLDFVAGGVVYFAVGAALARVVRERATWAERAAWGLAGWSVLTANYLIYDWWSQGQRESFYDLFLLGALACQLLAHGAEGARARRLLVAAGALVAITWFGKPTYVLYTVAQIVALAVERERGRALRAVAIGCAIGVAPMLAFLVVVGDVGAYVRAVLLETPILYRFIWNKTLAETYRAYNAAPKLNYALVTLAASTALLATKKLPRVMLAPVLFLAVGIATFFAQGKGFPYHLHPVTLATHFVWLACAAWFAERFVSQPARALGFATAAGAAALAYQTADEARLTDASTGAWYAEARAGRASDAYRARFNGGDFFALDMRAAAAFLRAATSPSERVQTYGMDPYLLFLSERLSATPFVYSFELNVDAALAGGSGRHPNDDERRVILDMAKRHERDLVAALERRPPAAFALLDEAPFTSPKNADEDFAAHCPDAYAWMRARYTPSGRFGVVRVWLRNDVAARAHGATP